MTRNSQIETFHIATFGCQMNLADSSTLVATMTTRGYQQVFREEEADLLILNTCSVREKAEQRVIGRLGEVKRFKRLRPHLKVAVIGCMAQRLGEGLLRTNPGADFVLGTDRLFELPDVLENIEGTTRVMTAFGHENMDEILPSRESPFSAFVTISRGCDNYCSYCIVPHVRGSERAHSADHIVRNVRSLVRDGVVEITLLGQNVNSYRHGDVNFPTLLERVMNETEVPRVRFMTSHPKDLSSHLIDIISREARIMPHVHLPLQSGADRVLEKMGRGYTIEEYMKIIDRLRETLDYVSLTTDLIVGFPSETKTEFEMTLEVVRHVKYDAAFMFRYSVRPGTQAADWDDTVSEEEKISRLNQLIEIQQQIGNERNQREVGEVRYGLVEGTSRRDVNVLRARTEGNKTALFEAAEVETGKVVPIRITSADAYTLHGCMEVTP
ncbi:MAG: tRNA (N6-isopentenyl adenosine(37)-C2)-methylthiotransferase MiaB [candidate division Zixibacteria bacterium]|nr:tRNA (N6-isopentenyl adenosine(37)-C2)-methylthiotransferase MiaB [candidate division Zixibacteria bacterium]